MATEKTLKARLKMKHGKASEWALATRFTPLEGEIIVYDVDETYTSPRFKVGDGTTNVNNLKFVNQDELAKITTLGDDLLAVKNGYLPLSGGTVTGTLTVNKELYSNAAVISKRNSTPQFIMQNANGAQLGTIYSTSSDGNYANIAISVNKDSSSAAYYTFSNFGRFASPVDVQTANFRAKSNQNPSLSFLNNSEAVLSEFYVATTDGKYGNAILKVSSSATGASYFTFKNDGIFAAPSDIISNGGVLKSSRNTNPCLALTNQNGAWLASLVAVTSDGSYGNAQLAVYKSATEGNTFTFSNQGSFRAPNIVYSSLFAVQSNNNPQLMLQNKNGAPLGMLYMGTTTGDYSNVTLRVYSAASAYKEFAFKNDGTFVSPSLTLGNALSITNGGTGATSAENARMNLDVPNTTLIKNTARIITVEGDKDHYYPVLISCSSVFYINRIAITRSYGETAPDDWGTDTAHKGGLTFQLQWNGDASCGGNGNINMLKVEALQETYCKMVGGLALSTTGIIVWLRGGTARYYILNEMGYALTAKVYYTTYTDQASKTFEVRTYDANKVETEITARQLMYNYLPKSGGNLFGSLVATKEVSGSQLYSKTNAYPGMFMYNASGIESGGIYIETDNGSYGDAVLSVHNSASDIKKFYFQKNGVFSIPNSFSTPMGEIKNTAWPQLFFRNGDGNNLAQFIIPTNDGSYNGLAVNVFSDASTHVEYKFNSDGTFVAPAGITINGNYVSIKNNSYPQLTFSNASGADIGKFFVSTTNGSYATTKIRAYSSASSYYDFQFVGNGTFNCATLVPANALGIAYGGTGATTAAGACSNIGALPKSGGVISGTLTVAKNGSPSIILANASNRYSAHLSMSTSDGSYGNVLLTVYSAASTTKVFSFDNDGTFVAPNATFDGGMVEVGGDDNQGKVGLGNANMGNWIYLRSSDEGALTVDNNLVYSDGTSVIYSSSTPSTTVKGTIWLKPV